MAKIKGHRFKYIPGDHLLICDRTGRVIRKSESRTEWNGLVVHKSQWEPRHPQDFLRGRKDKQVPQKPIRPEVDSVDIALTCTGVYDLGVYELNTYYLCAD